MRFILIQTILMVVLVIIVLVYIFFLKLYICSLFKGFYFINKTIISKVEKNSESFVLNSKESEIKLAEHLVL